MVYMRTTGSVRTGVQLLHSLLDSCRSFLALQNRYVSLVCSGGGIKLTGPTTQVNPKVDIGDGPMNFYYLGYFYGFGVSAGLHVLLSKVFPAKETMLHRSRTDADVAA